MPLGWERYTSSSPVMVPTLLTKRSDILALAAELHERSRQCGLLHDIALSSEYFLHYWSQNSAPRLLVFRDARRALVAAVFAYEEQFLGMNTGVITGGDACGQGLLLAPAERMPEVLRLAIQTFGREQRIHRIQWKCPQMAIEEGAPVLPYTRTIRRPLAPEPYQLPLPGTFDEFLAALGTQTRRNVRYYRRQCEKQGFEFVPSLHLAEFAEAGEALRATSRYPLPPWRHRKHIELLRSLPNILLAGIRDQTGRWVSLVAGWTHGRYRSILTQLNDDHYSKLSLSLVIRSYLVEQAIDEGLEQIVFVQGSSPVFGKYARPAFPVQIWVDFERPMADAFKRMADFVSGAGQTAGLKLPALTKLAPIRREGSSHPSWQPLLAVETGPPE